MGIDGKLPITIRNFGSGCIGVLLAVLAGWPLQAAALGEVEFARGAVTVDGRALASGDAIERGDRVITAGNGVAVLRLDDDSRMTLRPNSEFSIEALDSGERPSALLNLLRGGLRLVTGLIGRVNPAGYRVQTPNATIGIRGTEFSARICVDDCAADEAALADADVSESDMPVARVAFTNGTPGVIDVDGNQRNVPRDGPLFEGDRVQTDGTTWAVLVFRDDSRISLNPDTVFDIEEMRYDSERPQRNSALLRLVRGGLRVLTGLIGDLNPRAYRVATPIATIGIRGTGFDLQCRGACVAPGRDLGATVDAASSDGLFASTWDGIIDVELDTRTVAVEQGQTLFFANGATAPVTLTQVPDLLRNLLAPRPDTLQVPNLFDAIAPKDVGEGLYVNVDEGQVLLENQAGELALGPGEAGYVSDAASLPLRLSGVPKFQALDAIPSPGSFAPGEIELPDSLLEDLDAGAAAALGAAMLIGAGETEEQERAGQAAGDPAAAIPAARDDAEDYARLGFYFGAGGGFARPDADEEAIEDELSVINGGPIDITGFDDEGSGETRKFYVGYRFHPNIGVEVGSYDLGETDHVVNGVTDTTTFVDPALEEIPFPVTGIGITGNLMIPFGLTTERFTIFAKGGVLVWEGDSEFTINGQKYSRSFDGESSLVGVGFNLNFGDHLSLRIEAERIDIDPEPLVIGTAGIMIQF